MPNLSPTSSPTAPHPCLRLAFTYTCSPFSISLAHLTPIRTPTPRSRPPHHTQCHIDTTFTSQLNPNPIPSHIHLQPHIHTKLHPTPNLTSHPPAQPPPPKAHPTLAGTLRLAHVHLVSLPQTLHPCTPTCHTPRPLSPHLHSASTLSLAVTLPHPQCHPLPPPTAQRHIHLPLALFSTLIHINTRTFPHPQLTLSLVHFQSPTPHTGTYTSTRAYTQT